MLSSAAIKQYAAGLGFDVCGIAPASNFPELGFLSEWIARGYAGDMDYMEKSASVRADIHKFLPSARSVIVMGTVYNGDQGSGSGEQGSGGREPGAAIKDAIKVLNCANLHFSAQKELDDAILALVIAIGVDDDFLRDVAITAGIPHLDDARAAMRF